MQLQLSSITHSSISNIEISESNKLLVSTNENGGTVTVNENVYDTTNGYDLSDLTATQNKLSIKVNTNLATNDYISSIAQSIDLNIISASTVTSVSAIELNGTYNLTSAKNETTNSDIDTTIFKITQASDKTSFDPASITGLEGIIKLTFINATDNTEEEITLVYPSSTITDYEPTSVKYEVRTEDNKPDDDSVLTVGDSLFLETKAGTTNLTLSSDDSGVNIAVMSDNNNKITFTDEAAGATLSATLENGSKLTITTRNIDSGLSTEAKFTETAITTIINAEPIAEDDPDKNEKTTHVNTQKANAKTKLKSIQTGMAAARASIVNNRVTISEDTTKDMLALAKTVKKYGFNAALADEVKQYRKNAKKVFLSSLSAAFSDINKDKSDDNKAKSMKMTRTPDTAELFTILGIGSNKESIDARTIADNEKVNVKPGIDNSALVINMGHNSTAVLSLDKATLEVRKTIASDGSETFTFTQESGSASIMYRLDTAEADVNPLILDGTEAYAAGKLTIDNYEFALGSIVGVDNNTKPTANNMTVTGYADSNDTKTVAIDFASNISDADNDTLSTIIKTLPANGTLVDTYTVDGQEKTHSIGSEDYTVQGRVTYTAETYNVPVHFTYAAYDGQAESEPATVDVNIVSSAYVKVGLNADNNYEVVNEGDMGFSISLSDLFGSPNVGIQHNIVDGSSDKASIENQKLVISDSASLKAHETQNFNVTLSAYTTNQTTDWTKSSDTTTTVTPEKTQLAMDITVTGSNQAPSVTASVNNTFRPENGQLIEGTLNISDPDGESHTVSIVGNTPAGFTLDGLSYSLDPTEYKYLDASADYVAKANLPSILANQDLFKLTQDGDTYIMTLNTIVNVAAKFTDIKYDGSSIPLDYHPTTLEFEPTDPTTIIAYARVTTTETINGEETTKNYSIAYRADNDKYDWSQLETVEVAINVEDEDGGVTPQVLTFTITGINSSPEVTATTPVEYTEDNTTITGSFTAVDPEGHTLIFSLVDSNDAQSLNFSITANTGEWEFTVPDSLQGMGEGGEREYTIEYSVSDGTTTVNNNTLNITITGVNDNPEITEITETVIKTEDENVTGSLTATDPDGDNLTFSVNGNAPTGFTLNQNGTWELDLTDTVYQSLAPGSSKTLTINYKVTDNTTEVQANLPLVIKITGVNDAPEITAIVPAAVSEDKEDGIITATLSAKDIDGGELTYALVTTPNGVSLNDDIVSLDLSKYQHVSAGVTKEVEVSYSVSDGIVTSSPKLVFKITGKNDDPVVKIGSIVQPNDSATTTYTVPLGQQTSFSVTFSDIDESAELKGVKNSSKIKKDGVEMTDHPIDFVGIAIIPDSEEAMFPIENLKSFDSIFGRKEGLRSGNLSFIVDTSVLTEKGEYEVSFMYTDGVEDYMFKFKINATEIPWDFTETALVSTEKRVSLAGTPGTAPLTIALEYDDKNGTELDLSDVFTPRVITDAADSTKKSAELIVNTDSFASLPNAEEFIVRITISGFDGGDNIVKLTVTGAHDGIKLTANPVISLSADDATLLRKGWSWNVNLSDYITIEDIDRGVGHSIHSVGTVTSPEKTKCNIVKSDDMSIKLTTGDQYINSRERVTVPVTIRSNNYEEAANTFNDAELSEHFTAIPTIEFILPDLASYTLNDFDTFSVRLPSSFTGSYTISDPDHFEIQAGKVVAKSGVTLATQVQLTVKVPLNSTSCATLKYYVNAGSSN